MPVGIPNQFQDGQYGPGTVGVDALQGGVTARMLTPEQAVACKLANWTANPIPAGTVVRLSSTSDDSVEPAATSDITAVGVAYANIPAGANGIVVTQGPVDVLVDNAGGCVSGQWLGTSNINAGQATAGADPTLLVEHQRAVGRAMRSRATPGLVRAMIRFG